MTSRSADPEQPQERPAHRKKGLGAFAPRPFPFVKKRDLPAYLSVLRSATRRFFARPSSVALSAIGWVSP